MFKLFKKIYLKSSTLNDKNLAFGLPAVPKLGQLLNDQKYEEFLKAYEQLQNDEKTFLLDGLALNENYLRSIFDWKKAAPDNYLANLFAGVAYTLVAWQNRTGQLAKYLTDQQVEGFHKCLIQANNCLVEAATLKPGEAETYSRLIRVNMGLSDKMDARQHFKTLLELDPKHLGGHMFMINLLSPKWLGSFEEMQDFAFQFKEASKSQLLYVIFLMFVVAYYVDLSDADLQQLDQKIKKKFKSTVLESYAQLDIPNMASLQRYQLHNYFSYVFYLLDENRLRNQEIDQVGKNLAFFPWAYAEVDGYRDLQLIKLR